LLQAQQASGSPSGRATSFRRFQSRASEAKQITINGRVSDDNRLRSSMGRRTARAVIGSSMEERAVIRPARLPTPIIIIMAKPNYSGEKRRKELEKQKKKEAKKQRKLEQANAPRTDEAPTDGDDQPQVPSPS
jgi:hypothetical protein